MGAPASQGRLCTTLKEMEIGDYIRCSYTASTANVAGDFTDLGSAVPGVMELPTTAAATANGYFYFLKVDQGLLVADRMVQSSISAQSLNAKNYLNGGDVDGKIIRCLSQTEWTKYLTNGNLNGCVTKQDAAVWHQSSSPTSISAFYHNAPVIRVELVDNASKGEIRTVLNISGATFDSTYHIKIVSTGVSGGPINYYPIFVDAKAFSVKLPGSGWNDGDKEHICFRPALEYIDNAKSKTNWY